MKCFVISNTLYKCITATQILSKVFKSGEVACNPSYCGDREAKKKVHKTPISTNGYVPSPRWYVPVTPAMPGSINKRINKRITVHISTGKK
jgi:hypothetical protein